MIPPITNGAELRGKTSAMIVCWLLGNGSLFVWNSMLSAEDYYLSLFPRYHPTRVFTLVYVVITLVTSSILTYYEATINTRKRNLIGYLLLFLSALAIPVLDLATSGNGGLATYIGLCCIAVIFGLGDGCVEGGMLGDLSLMCPEFIQSFLAGGAASGVLTSVLRLSTKGVFEKSKNGLRKGATSEGSKTVMADLAAAGVKMQQNEVSEKGPNDELERLSHKQLLLENKDYAIIAFLATVLSFSIFPGFLAEDTGKHGLGTWYALVLIAMYNVLDFLARYIPLVESLKLESRRGLMIATISRFSFVPAFYFTAKYGDQGWMILLTSLLGLTNGYLAVCLFTVAPTGYKGPEQNALGNLLTICVLGGLVTDVILSLDWAWLIGKVGKT
ncbi:hypothetical protein MKW92_034230 [Papaver armeniacum]|nr:hypothetical protein MKW92_034230 [Papaver armeniacum]